MENIGDMFHWEYFPRDFFNVQESWGSGSSGFCAAYFIVKS